MIQTAHAPLTEEQKALVLECSERIGRLAWKYSRNTFDFEDMYALGMEEVCRLVARVETYAEPIGYLYRSAQNAMIDELKRQGQCRTVSLDVPLSRESAFCLADILPSRSSLWASCSSCAALVESALSRLSKREREVMLCRYGFDCCSGTCSSAYAEIGHALSITRSGAASIATVAHRKLRADVQLCQALGIEPEPKQEISQERRAELRATSTRELEAFHAGARSINRLAKVLGIPRSTAAKRLATMRQAGLIPTSQQKGGPA